MSVLTTARAALGRLSVALHSRLAAPQVESDAGMTTAEYAVVKSSNTPAAAGVGAVDRYSDLHRCVKPGFE